MNKYKANKYKAADEYKRGFSLALFRHHEVSTFGDNIFFTEGYNNALKLREKIYNEMNLFLEKNDFQSINPVTTQDTTQDTT